MNDLPSYSDYKESGVEWLGKIPSHWLLIKNKFILNFSKGLTITKENLIDEGIPCVNYGEVHSKFGFEVDPNKHSLKCVPEIYLNDFPNALLKKGDFIFADTSEDIKGSGNFTYLNSELPTFAGYHTIIAKINNINYPRYLAYVFDCDSYRNQIRAQVKGIKVFSITQFMLKNSIVWLPPLEEQKAITRYLDKKLAQIDTLITKQQALLEKLAEQRIALISNAVTKGLNPDVEMKESGVEWLGKIPLDWTIKRLKFLLVGKLKYGANESAESEDLGQPRYIRITDIDEKGNLRDETFKSLEIEKAQEYLLKDLDILLARSGATVGKSYLYHKNSVGSACYAGYLIRARLNFHKFDAEFVNYFLQSKNYWDWINSINIQSTIQNVSAEKYSDLVLAIPPLLLQKQIVQILKAEDLEFEITTNKGNELITLLKEYRSTLITQAVTGKIDVRNLAN